MEKQKIRISVRMIPVLTAMVLSLLIVMPVQAAPDNEAMYAAVFDSAYYADHYPDLQAAFGNDSSLLLNHFITYGMLEGRQGNAEFNVQYYKAAYPDLQNAFGENLDKYYLHYITNGKAEGRTGNGEIPDSGHTAETNQNINSVEGSASAYAYEVLDLVNQVRAENGIGKVSATQELMNAAQVRAMETTTLFSHDRPDGSSCFTAFQQSGAKYRTAGENIAAGQPTPASVIDAWMHSTGHRANILNPEFKHLGVGYCQTAGGYGSYWVQCFTD